MYFFKVINSIVKLYYLWLMKIKELIGSMIIIGRVVVFIFFLGMGKIMCIDKFVYEGSLCGLNSVRIR